MTEMQLVPLNCLECRHPIPAQPDEVAWVCSECGKGQRLSDEDNLIPLDVRYSASIAEGKTGRPFWVVVAEIQINRRVVAQQRGVSDESVRKTWEAPRRFFIPAFNLSIQELLSGVRESLFSPPETVPGPPAAFHSVTRRSMELQPLIEFLVMSIEADREDKLSYFKFTTVLEEPEFWILP